MKTITTFLLLAAISTSSAFLPSPTIITRTAAQRPLHRQPIAPISAPSARQITPSSPRSRSPSGINNTRLHSFFGLGPAELIIIGIAGIIFIGPSKLLQFSKEAGNVAGKQGSQFGDELGDLKAIPEEFQKGVEEGEIKSRMRKAKDAEIVQEGEE
eukprot:CAMPEP_0201902268 /NCGR_PEP_ID=MMETSP0902-20130614/54868_1 /ASSEMBLY_ACC=CAM_ASM_000551 /TAXON_ID=420261 /ORGANISM="Thalassiosira antarctica, Strain CCMP982" /LENGTH=155 /DNA_ID=CAMNT_0048436265 /DNA_START=45 /DNA_END=515 /DNA_ORIENTATION=+